MKVLRMTILLSLALAPPAQAHFGRTRPAGYVSRVERVVSGAGVRAHANSAGWITVSVPIDREVVVLGYSREPYLRFAHDAVYENERSPTAFVNRGVPPPRSADAAAAPRWRAIGQGRRWTWHDHRVHWMSPTPPSVVRSSPHRSHHLFDWSVPMRVDHRPAVILGTLDWQPTGGIPGVWWWLALAFAGGLTVYVAYRVLWKDAVMTDPRR